MEEVADAGPSSAMDDAPPSPPVHAHGESTTPAKADAVLPAAEDEPPVPVPSSVVEAALKVKIRLQIVMRKVTQDLKATEARVRAHKQMGIDHERADRALAAGKRVRESRPMDVEDQPSVMDDDDGDSPTKRHRALDETDTGATATEAAAGSPEAAAGSPEAAPADSGEPGEVVNAPPPQDAAAAASAGDDDDDRRRPAALEVSGAGGGSAAADADALNSAERGGSGGSARRRRPDSATDAAGRQRNRNMFGMLLGTLKKAQKEVAESSTGAVQQAKLLKVDEKLRDDRVRLLASQKERVAAGLARDHERAQALHAERKLLDEKLRRIAVLIHEASLANFLPTVTQPPLLYLPAQHTAATRKKLTESQMLKLPPILAELETIAQLPPATIDSHGPPVMIREQEVGGAPWPRGQTLPQEPEEDEGEEEPGAMMDGDEALEDVLS